MNTPIFIGKFQPVHKGHLLVIQGMVKTQGSPIIVITDPVKEKRNPQEDLFSLEERKEMFTSMLLDAGILDATIVSCSDTPHDDDWVTYVQDACEKKQSIMVWSGRDDVRALFERKGIPTKKIVHVPGIDGDVLRKAIINGDASWKKQVPEAAHGVITRKFSR